MAASIISCYLPSKYFGWPRPIRSYWALRKLYKAQRNKARWQMNTTAIFTIFIYYFHDIIKSLSQF